MGRRSYSGTYESELTRAKGGTTPVIVVGDPDKKVFVMKSANGGTFIDKGSIGKLRSTHKLGGLVPLKATAGLTTTESGEVTPTINNPI